MIEHPEFRTEMRQQYIDYGAQFAIEKCIDKMEQMFTDALQTKKS